MDKRMVALIVTWTFMAIVIYSAFSSVDNDKKVATNMEDFYDDNVNPRVGYGIGMSGKSGLSYEGWVLTEDGIEPGIGF